MKIDKLDAHDRLQHFNKQSVDINECCKDLIDKRPFGNHAFYIFAHVRTDEDGFTKRLIWQPRLTKPKSQTNSMLFKAYPGSDLVKVIWMIPAREVWEQYRKGNLTENQTVVESIYDFEHNRNKLDAKEDDDLNDEEINQIYRDLCLDAKFKKHMDKLYDIKPKT
jgi:hypothetical protein